MTITKVSHYHGDLSDAYGLDFDGMDQSDSVFLSKAKAAKHVGTTSQPPTYAGGTHSYVTLDSEPISREFLECVFQSFRVGVLHAMTHMGVAHGWFEVEFTNLEIQNLAAGKFTGGAATPHAYRTVRIGASVKRDQNGYTFLFNHGPLVT